MRLDVKVENLGALVNDLQRLSGPEMRAAHAAALNDVGHQLRRAMQADIRAAFDRPTSWVTGSPWVHPATPDKLHVAVLPTRRRDGPGRGGKAGVDPQDILQAQEWGGTRRDKRSEGVLRRAGLLPAGYQTAIPKVPYPGSDDGNGNLRGTFLRSLLSYLGTFAEVGYFGNMKKRAKAKFEGARAYSNARTRQQHQERDQRFFVVLPGRAKTRHLAPGIWAARGTHGADLRPVLMFVRTPSYRPRLSMQRVADSMEIDDYFARRMRYRLRLALGQ